MKTGKGRLFIISGRHLAALGGLFAVLLLPRPLAAMNISIGPEAAVFDCNAVEQDGLDGEKISPALAVGARLVFDFNWWISLQTGLSLEWITWRYEPKGTSGWEQYGFTAVGFPIALRYDQKIGSSWKLYALAGVKIDFLIGKYSGKDSSGFSGSAPVKGSFFHRAWVNISTEFGTSVPIGPGILDTGIGIDVGLRAFYEGSGKCPLFFIIRSSYRFTIRRKPR